MPLPLISARPPSALNSCIVTSRRPSPTADPGGDPQEAVGADAAMAIADGARGRTRHRAGAVQIEQDEEVVAEAVVLGQPHRDSSVPVTAPRPTRFARGGPRLGRDPTRRGAIRCADHGGTRPVAGGRTAGCGARPGRGPRPACTPPCEVRGQLLVAERLAPRSATALVAAPASGGPRRRSRRRAAGGSEPRCGRPPRSVAARCRRAGTASAGTPRVRDRTTRTAGRCRS